MYRVYFYIYKFTYDELMLFYIFNKIYIYSEWEIAEEE